MNTALPNLFAVVDGTWPAASTRECGPFVLREGQGGGNRVSAASLRGGITNANKDEIDIAAGAMRVLGQKPIFMIRPEDTRLDALLDQLGYVVRDPVTAYACPVESLCDTPLPRVCAFSIWRPLAIMLEIWEAGGIGAARIAVMDRALGPKTGLLGRHADKPAGTGFVAIHDRVAMIHALEILPHQRRCGMGGWMTRAAAFWAAANGAETLAVLCTEQNTGANALYTSLGMAPVGHYHYRHLPEEPEKT